MLGGMEVGNFKAFKDVQRIPLRPITLIFGANSSGKSSILHALLLLRSGLDTGEWGAHVTDLGGEAVDLGGFPAFLHGHDSERPLTLGALVDHGFAEVMYSEQDQFELQDQHVGFTDVGVSITLTADATELRSAHLTPVEVKVTSAGLPCFTASHVESSNSERSPRNEFGVTGLDLGSPFLRDVMDAAVFMQKIKFGGDEVYLANLPPRLAGMRLADGNTASEVVSELVCERGTLNLTSRIEGTAESASALAARFAMFDDRISPIDDPLANAIDVFWSLIQQASYLVRPILMSALEKLEYLGPLRAYPVRHVSFGGGMATLQAAAGARAWEAVLRDAVVRQRVNDWLGSDFLATGYRFSERVQYALDDIAHAHALMEGDPALSFAEGLQQVPPSTRDLVLTDLRTGTTVSHRDIGLGVSQVLPVLVAALGSAGRQVLLEQPELHLHPALQAELGDVFIRGAAQGGGSRFVIETHSEHLILRVLRRIRETSAGEHSDDGLAISTRDVAVLYVESTRGGSVVREIPVTDDGDFADRWPEGFFAQRAAELF